MARLTLTFLGSFQAALDGAPIARFQTNKVRALLAYLAIEAERPHSRASLCGLLWPDQSDEAALQNLSQTLLRLREALGDTRGAASFLHSSRQSLQWNAASDHQLDAADFMRLASSADSADLEQAAALYHGEFLPGFSLPGCEAFEEWLLLTRERFAHLALTALDTLTRAKLASGRYEEAARHARRQLALDPWREDAHRQLMQALAASGDRAGALAAYERCRQVLEAELGVEPDEQTRALYEQIRGGQLGPAPGRGAGAGRLDASAPRDEHTPPGENLPAPPTLPSALIGRAQDVAAVSHLLRQADVRLLTLIGPGGVGKTCLALQVAGALLSDDPRLFPDGVAFVDLSAIGDTDLVAKIIAQALSVHETNDTAILARLKEYLHDRQLLLILDNFEQVIGATPQVAELLAACPQLKALITSRTALRLRAEHAFPVPALALPPLTPLPDLGALAEYGAVALFVERAQPALPSFQLSAANARTVAEICVRLDGLPLALELAAARLRLIAPHDLLARLSAPQSNAPLRLLTKSARDGPARQQTLYHTIAWSEQLLDPDLQALFARLGVFVGGCTAEAAEAVCGGWELGVGSWGTDSAAPPPISQSPTPILDGLAALLDHSLLRQEVGADGAPRFRMLETIREYALERLAACGELNTLRQRHAAYFLTLAEVAEPQLQGSDQWLWLDRLELEHDNLRAALSFCLEAKDLRLEAREETGSPSLTPQGPNPIEMGLRLAAALGEFWWPRGHLKEGRHWLARVLEWSYAPPAARAKALYRAGELAYGQADYHAAIPLLEQSLALYRQLKDKRGLACVLRGLGNTRSALGDEPQAATLHAESLALFQEVGDTWGIAWMLLEIGRTEPDPARQRALLEQSLTLARRGGYKRTIATVLGGLGRLARSKGQHQQADQLFQEALALGRELRDTWIVVSMLFDLGLLARDEGEHARATALLEESLALFREIGYRYGVAWALQGLGEVARNQGDLGRAALLFEECKSLCQEVGNKEFSAIVLSDLAVIALAQGSSEQAAALYQESLSLHRELGDKRGVAKCLEGLAEMALAQGRPEQAVRLLAAAAALSERVNAQAPFILPADHTARDRTLAAAQARLSDAVFAAAWAEGQVMPLERATAEVRVVGTLTAEPTSAVAEQHPTTTTPSASSPAPIHNLPSPLSSFVGREDELAHLAALLDGDARLITVVGAGGMGKTRLALEVVRLRLADPSPDQSEQIVEPARPAFRDGFFFVSLAPLTTAAAIVPAIASAVGLSLHGDPKQALLRFLRDKQLLLILDNFEHLLDGVELVVEILQIAPLVQLIATSRERLKVRGEHVFVVEGMEYQAEDRVTSSAIRLFVQSARRVRADFTLTEENLPLLMRICDLVQGMPLGIELAAARVEMLPVERIAAEIERSAEFLAYDWRDAPERQRSMRAVFDWSWNLLNDAEQQALRGLSVFRGGCTLEAAQAVANTSPQILTSLVHKSLLRWSWAQGEVGRYEMHELLRQFAARSLGINPAERAAVEARHSAFYLTFVAERETRLVHNEPSQAAEEIRGEIDNVRQAWAWAATQTHISELARSVYGLWQFYWLTGLSSEGEQVFGLAAECVRRRMSALESAQEVRNSQSLSSKLLAGQAHFMNLQAKYDHAIPLAQQAVALGEASKDHTGAAMGYVRWGQALIRKGLCIDARPHFERALHFARAAQSIGSDSESLSDLEWDALVWLGFVATSQGNYDEARTHLAQGLRICQTLGNRRGECRCFIDTGEIAMTVGDYAAASTYFQAALRLAHEHGNLWYEGMAHLFLGMVAFAEGNYTLASNSTEAALNTFHNIGDPAFEAWALAGCGRLADSLGDYAHARDWLDQSLYLSQKVGAWEAQFYGCAFLALVLHHLGDDETACRWAEQSRRIALEAGDRSRQADAWLALGRTHEGLNRLTDAVSAYQYASALYAELGRAHMVTEPRAGLARIALVQGDLMQARRHIEDILTFLENHPLIGPDEPFMIYLTCYRVLEASGDVRATSLLRRAEQRLRECAEHITDDTLRRSFLENVAAHHAILTLAHTTATSVGAR